MVPDLFNGDPVPLNRPPGMDMQAWRNGEYHPQGIAHLPPNIDPIVDACVAEMRTKYRCKVSPTIQPIQTIHQNSEEYRQ
jgi:hypothetical protein